MRCRYTKEWYGMHEHKSSRCSYVQSVMFASGAFPIWAIAAFMKALVFSIIE